MQNTHQYFVNGRLVYVPEDELSDFKENCADNGFDYEEGEVFRATNGANEVHEFTVPKSQIEAFRAAAAENGGRADPMTMLTMDDGNRLTLRDEDVRQFVQARRQGMPMSRGLLKNTGIPDWYGKGVADREALADALGGMFFPEDTATATDNALPREGNFGDALARGGNVIAETAAPAIAAVKGFGEGLVRSVTDPAALYAETYGEDSPIANALLGSQDFANTAVRGGMDVAAKALGGRDSVAGRTIRDVESALPTDQASVETGSGIGNAVVGFANDFSKNTLSTIMKYAAPGVAAVDIAGSVVDNYYDGYERAIANGANQDKANALASAAAGIGSAEGIWLAQSAAGGQTANAVKAGLKRILGMGGKMGATAGARDVVEQGIEGAENPDLVRTGKEVFKGAAEGALFEAASMGVHGLAGTNDRRMDSEARRTTQERAAEAEKENARVDARTRYEANLSEEARADVERNVNEMVKSEVIPSYRQADEVAKLAESKLTRETGESAEAVQQAVMEAAQEVSERLQTPSRVETPALERRQTEARMRENERWAKRSDELAAEYEAEQAKPAERAPNDAEAVAATQAEERSARQADLEAAFADWTDADAKVADAVKTQKRGGAVKNVEAMKRGAEEAKQRALTRLQKMETADLEDNIGTLEAIENPPKKIQNQLQAMKDELARRNGNATDGKEQARTDIEQTKPTDDVSDSERNGVFNVSRMFENTISKLKQKGTDSDIRIANTLHVCVDAANEFDRTHNVKGIKYLKSDVMFGAVRMEVDELVNGRIETNQYLFDQQDGSLKKCTRSGIVTEWSPNNSSTEQSSAPNPDVNPSADSLARQGDASTTPLPKSADPKAGGRAQKATDAAFRAWAVDRDGKPIEFATKADEAQSRETFDMLVKMGKVDAKTGKAVEPKRSKAQEPIETELDKVSQTPPASSAAKEVESTNPTAGADETARQNPLPTSEEPKLAKSPTRIENMTEAEIMDLPDGTEVSNYVYGRHGGNGKPGTKWGHPSWVYHTQNGKQIIVTEVVGGGNEKSYDVTMPDGTKFARKTIGEAIQYANELAPKKGFESVNSPFKRNPLPKSADPKAGGRSAKEETATETQYDRAVKAVESAEKESANARSFDELADINSRARSALGKITREQENELMSRLEKTWNDNKGRVEDVRSQGGYTPSKEIIEAKSRIEAMPTSTSREKASKKKAQKDWLLSSVDDSIKSHGDTRTINDKPFAESFADEFESLIRRRNATYERDKLDKLNKQIDTAKKTMAQGEMLTFDVPDDGTFKIRNNPEALAVFKRMVQKRLSPTNLKEGTISKAEKPLAEDVKEANIGEKVTSPASSYQTSAKASANQTTNPDTPVASAQKLLKERFYADEKTLARQLAALPAQAPADLRAAYETALAEAKKRKANQDDVTSDMTKGGKFRGVAEQKNQQNQAAKMADPNYLDAMKKDGRPVNWATRQDYDRKNAETAVGNLRRLVPNLKVVWEKSENAQPTPSAQLIRAKSGENLGWFDPSDASVHYLPGADVTTAAHETLGHVAKAYFEQTNPALAQKMLDYGRTAPNSIKTAVDSIYGAGAATDEYMAWRIQQDGALKLLQKAKTDADRKWIGKLVASANEMRKDIAMKLGGNRINAEKMMSMTPAQMMDYLSSKAVEGKTLGNIKRRETVRMSKADGWSDTKNDVWERNLHDYRNDIKTLQSDAEKALGRKLTEAEDAYTDFRLMPGKLQNIKDSVDSKLAEYQKMLKDSEISHEDMVKFMQAEATMERVDNLTNELGVAEMARRGDDFGTGMSKLKAAEIIQSMQDIGKYRAAKDIQQFLLDMQAEGLQQRVNDGLLDYQTAADWVAKEQMHVPFKSGVDADGNFVRWDAKQGLIGSNEFKKAKGRETLAGDSISWMFDEYAHAFSRGAENQARQKMLRLVQSLNANGSKVAEIIPMDASSVREMTKRPGNGGTGDANVFEVKVDGKSYSVRLDGERGDLLVAAINGRNLRAMPQGWQKFMRVYSNFATAWSPTFGLRNFLGDSIDIAGNYTGEYGYIKGKKAQAIHAAEVAKLTPALIKYVATGKANGKFANVLHAYEAAGGKISGFKNQGYADISNLLHTEIKRGTSAKDAILKYTGLAMAGRGMEAYNSYFELVNRLASFETSRRMGKSDRDAALWSRESTVDFNMKGNLTGISNGLYMFSNSALGASARQLKSLLGSRKGASLAASLFAYGFAEGALEAWVNGDEEDAIKSGDTTGKDISEYTRANSIYFRKGNTVFRVPFHAGPFALVKYLGNLTARYAAGKVSEKNASAIKGEDIAKKLTKEAASDATQLLGLGNVNFDTKDGTLSSTAIAALVTAVPTISQQVLQPIMNVDYAGRTHHKETMDREKPASYNGRKQTSQTAKDVAMAINDATASEGSRKGIVDFSPETYQSMFKGLFKNVASDVDKAASVGRMLMGTEDVDIRKIPFASDYVRTSDSGNTDRYYAAKKDFDANVDYFKKHVFEDGDERRKYIKKFPWVTDKRVQRIIDRVDYYRRLEDGQYRNKSGKWVPHEWSKEQTNGFEAKRKELQAILLKIMKRD